MQNPLLRTHFWGRRNHITCWLKILLVAGLFSSSAFNPITSLLSFLWQRKSKTDHQQFKKKNKKTPSGWECGMFAWTVINGSPRISTPKGLRGKHYLEQVGVWGWGNLLRSLNGLVSRESALRCLDVTLGLKLPSPSKRSIFPYSSVCADGY